MRITGKEREAILSAVRAWDVEAVVYLFGSRARDDLRGGDIDLLVISERISFPEKLDILVRIKSRIGEQKIDLKTASSEKAAKDPFIRSILPGAIRL